MYSPDPIDERPATFGYHAPHTHRHLRPSPRPPRTPDRSAFTRAELRIIDALRTPFQVQRFLRAFPYNWMKNGVTMRTFRGVVEHGEAHCLEAVLFAATVLNQHGYPPLVLDIESEDGLDHVLFLYRQDGRWGTVARSRDYGLHGRKPVFKTIRSLVETYVDPYVDGSGRVIGYGTAHLDEIVRTDWRLSRRNNWEVERALIRMPHSTYHMSDARHDRVLQRFRQYKARGFAPTRRTMRRIYGSQIDTWL